jgi:hypothetical protein
LRAETQNEGYPGPSSLFLLLDLDHHVRGISRGRVLEPNAEFVLLEDSQPLQLADVGRATIAAIETGKRPRPHPPTRERLAKALKVKPEDLA